MVDYGSSFEVILANLWLKEFEIVLRKECPIIVKPMENQNGFVQIKGKELGTDRKLLNVKTD